MPKDLEIDFNNNVDPIDRNEAVTVRTKEFLNKMDSNKFEMNGNELILRDSLRKVSTHESYYEFNNNLKIKKNSDNRDDQIPKTNNEFIRSEENHQNVQTPKHNRTSMLHINLNLELGNDYNSFILINSL